MISLDFDGNELPEEIPAERPPQKKATVIIKKVFKYTFITIVTLVWVFILLSIFLRRDDAILKTPILSANARKIYTENKNDFPIYEVHTKEHMNYDGSFQLETNVYAEKAGELEIGLRIAWTQLRYCEECGRLYTTEQLDSQKAEDKKNGVPTSCEAKGHHIVRAPESDRKVVWALTDSDGNVYEELNRESRMKNLNFGFFKIRYEYVRICFGKVYINVSENIINTAGNEEVTDTGKGTLYYFRIYDEVTGDTLFSTCLYDNQTYIEEFKYELPDKDYIS